MANGTIRMTLRPVRLAFLVEPTDRHALLQAIEVNTFLWEGSFNPIIPTYRRTPRIWRDTLLPARSGREIVEGYVDAYDPDKVVPIENCSAERYDIGARVVILVSDVLAGVEVDGTPKYGVGLFEIADHLIQSELKFQRHERLEVYAPGLGSAYLPFLASLFGILPSDIDTLFRTTYVPALGAQTPSVPMANYTDICQPQAWFPGVSAACT